MTHIPRQILERYISPTFSDDESQFRIELSSSLRNLEEVLERISNAVEFGPIPGSYAVFNLRHSDPAGLAGGAVDAFTIGWDMAPIYVGADVDQGELVMNMLVTDSPLSGGTVDLLASDLSVPVGGAQVNKSADFAVDTIKGNSSAPDGSVTLEIVSITSGVPEILSAVLVCKYLGKIEPA